MEVTRKQLLAGGAALALAGCGGSKQDAGGQARGGPRPRYRHFDAFLFAAHGKPVRDAIERHRRGLDAGAAAYLHEHQGELERAVASAAASYWARGGRARVHRLDHDGPRARLLRPARAGRRGPHHRARPLRDHEALRLAGARVQARRALRRPGPGQRRRDAQPARRGITPRTKVVALTWVHSGTGVKCRSTQLDVQPSRCRRRRRARPRAHRAAHRRRRLRRRHAQVAGRPARHGPDLDARDWEPDRAGTIPSFALSSDPGPRFTPGGWHSSSTAGHSAEAFEAWPEDAPQRIRTSPPASRTAWRSSRTSAWSRRATPPSAPGSSASRSTGWTRRRVVDRLDSGTSARR